MCIYIYNMCVYESEVGRLEFSMDRVRILSKTFSRTLHSTRAPVSDYIFRMCGLGRRLMLSDPVVKEAPI